MKRSRFTGHSGTCTTVHLLAWKNRCLWAKGHAHTSVIPVWDDFTSGSSIDVKVSSWTWRVVNVCLPSR